MFRIQVELVCKFNEFCGAAIKSCFVFLEPFPEF